MRQSTPLPDGVDLVPITTSELPSCTGPQGVLRETQDCPNSVASAASMTSSKAMEPWVRLNRGWMLLRVHGCSRELSWSIGRVTGGGMNSSILGSAGRFEAMDTAR